MHHLTHGHLIPSHSTSSEDIATLGHTKGMSAAPGWFKLSKVAARAFDSFLQKTNYLLQKTNYLLIERAGSSNQYRMAILDLR